MANGSSVTDEMDPGLQDPGADPGASGPPSQDAGQPGMQRPDGGPMLAALARRQEAPQVSAPGPGNQADAMNKISMGIQMIQGALMGLPLGSKLRVDAQKAMATLERHLGQGFQGPAAGIQRTALTDMLRSTIQNFIMARQQSMQGMGQPGQPGGGGGQPPGGGQLPMAPPASTPLPGA